MTIMQKRTFAPALLIAGALWLALAGMAFAERGGESAVTLVPANGRGVGVRLRTQTVDVTIAEDDQGVWADTRIWLQLSNPYTRSITVTLALPGPQPIAGDLPANLHITAGETDLPLQPAGPPANGLRTAFSIAGKAEAAVQMTYRQALSETQGLVTYAYPLAAAGQWGQAPESLRLTLNFALPVAAGQILGHAPEYRRVLGQSLSWSWDRENAPDIWLAFLAPSWWQEFTSLQAAAAAPEATAAQHLALSEMYQRLAATPPLSFQPDVDFYARYYPAAVAALQAAAAAPVGDAGPTAEAVTAHAALAAIYRGQADRLGRGAGDTYLELAAAEAQAALALGASDPALSSLASDTYLQLAAVAKARGDAALAESYLARRAVAGRDVGGEEHQAARLALAADAVVRGDLLTARRVVSETYGAEAIDLPALRRPLAGQTLVTVDTTIDSPSVPLDVDAGSSLAGRRRMAATLVDSPDPAALARLIAEAAQAWRGLPAVTIKTGPDWLSVEFPFRDGRSLNEIQTRLARLLPNLPEFALLTAALTPDALDLQATQDRLQSAWHYTESPNLSQAGAAWQGRAAEIRAAAARLAAQPTPAPAQPAVTAGQPEGSSPPALVSAATPRPDLGQVQRAVWGANADAWTSLADRSYARYSVRLGADGAARQWHLAAGAQRGLNADRITWVPETLLMILGGAAFVLLLLAVLLWRVL